MTSPVPKTPHVSSCSGSHPWLPVKGASCPVFLLGIPTSRQTGKGRHGIVHCLPQRGNREARLSSELTDGVGYVALYNPVLICEKLGQRRHDHGGFIANSSENAHGGIP